MEAGCTFLAVLCCEEQGQVYVHEAKGNAFNDSYNLGDVLTDNTEETKDR